MQTLALGTGTHPLGKGDLSVPFPDQKKDQSSDVCIFTVEFAFCGSLLLCPLWTQLTAAFQRANSSSSDTYWETLPHGHLTLSALAEIQVLNGVVSLARYPN